MPAYSMCPECESNFYFCRILEETCLFYSVMLHYTYTLASGSGHNGLSFGFVLQSCATNRSGEFLPFLS